LRRDAGFFAGRALDDAPTQRSRTFRGFVRRGAAAGAGAGVGTTSPRAAATMARPSGLPTGMNAAPPRNPIILVLHIGHSPSFFAQPSQTRCAQGFKTCEPTLSMQTCVEVKFPGAFVLVDFHTNAHHTLLRFI
jgi:hypothetical protein